MADNDLVTILTTMLADFPNVQIEQKANHVTFRASRKVFAYTRDDSVVIKLPREKIKTLITQRKAVPLVMGKKEMKEWAVIRHNRASAFKKDRALFEAAVAFALTQA